jgi:CheY-like chemotaxis protein
MPTAKRIVAVVSDLMFTVKIQDAAKRAGMEVIFVQTEQAALEQARQEPAVIILDLNNSSVQVLDLISKLKADELTRHISLLGYVSHVQTDLKQTAQEKGCDLVIARSALSQNLPTILKRYTDGLGLTK